MWSLECFNLIWLLSVHLSVHDIKCTKLILLQYFKQMNICVCVCVYIYIYNWNLNPCFVEQWSTFVIVQGSRDNNLQALAQTLWLYADSSWSFSIANLIKEGDKWQWINKQTNTLYSAVVRQNTWWERKSLRSWATAAPSSVSLSPGIDVPSQWGGQTVISCTWDSTHLWATQGWNTPVIE